MRGSLCRRIRCASTRCTPAAFRRDAVVWRRSCQRMGRTSAFGHSFRPSLGQRRSSPSEVDCAKPQPCRRQTCSKPVTMSARASARRRTCWSLTSSPIIWPFRRGNTSSLGEPSMACFSQGTSPSGMGSTSAWPPFVVSRRQLRCTTSSLRFRSTSHLRRPKCFAASESEIDRGGEEWPPSRGKRLHDRADLLCP
jgi:hypothetical protein